MENALDDIAWLFEEADLDNSYVHNIELEFQLVRFRLANRLFSFGPEKQKVRKTFDIQFCEISGFSFEEGVFPQRCHMALLKHKATVCAAEDSTRNKACIRFTLIFDSGELIVFAENFSLCQVKSRDESACPDEEIIGMNARALDDFQNMWKARNG